MLVTSSFHDYYDSILSYGIDKTVVYNRQEQIIKVKTENSFYGETYQKRIQGLTFQVTVSKHVIGFCGALYPVVQITLSRKETSTNYFFYDNKKLETFLKKIKVDSSAHSYVWRRYFRLSSSSGMESFFDPKTWKSELEPQFQKHKVPVFILSKNNDRDYVLILNPQLKKFNFMKIKDPASAFQSIYMYISGVLGVPAKPMIQLKDKELAAKKGHGDKYSFRKTPGKRGKKQWR